MIYTCYFDGACMPKNPGGTIGYGWLYFDGTDYKEKNMLMEGIGGCPAHSDNSNNVAEYMAFNYLLSNLIETMNIIESELIIMGDSQLVVMQMNGIWNIKHGLLYSDYAKKGLSLLKEANMLTTKKITIKWVPREQNMLADKLSKLGANKYLNNGVREL